MDCIQGRGRGREMSRLSKHKRRENKSVVSNPFSIQLNDRFIISPIEYHNGFYAVACSTELLDGGEMHTQDDWIEYSQGSGWSLPSGPMYHATLAALYRERDGIEKESIKKIKELFKKDFANYSMMTSTRIEYSKSGLDKVVHDLGLSDSYELKNLVAGPWCFVNDNSCFDNTIDALLGTKDLDEVEQVYEWVSGKKPYFWRLNNPDKKERVLVLGFGSHSFGIGAYVDIDGCEPARGVVRRKISTGSEGKKK